MTLPGTLQLFSCLAAFHLQLVLTAVTCVAALLFVCLFTLSLLRGVKQQSTASSQNREVCSRDRLFILLRSKHVTFRLICIDHSKTSHVWSRNVSERLFFHQISSDYVTMMPGVTTAAETTGSHSPPDCTDLTALKPPPDVCSDITSKHRHSSVTPSLTDYVDVEEQGQMCQEQQYQHLDPSLLEEHIYYSLHQTNNPKDQSVEVEDQGTA